jgi:hypothetical protein
MRTLIRAAIVGTLGLCLAAMVSYAADPAPVPEWHQDLEYLTWDRGLDAPVGVDGRQVFLHPTDEALAIELGEAWSADVAPVWHERVVNLYVSLFEHGKHLLGFGGGDAPVEEPVGIALRSDGATLVR